MDFPKDLSYSKSHEWVRESGGVAMVGLTDYAQRELGDIVFVSLPEVGGEAVRGEQIADVESVKAVSEIFSPLSGAVKAVNQAAAASPELINSDPYGTWLFEIEDITAREELLSADGYEEYCGDL